PVDFWAFTFWGFGNIKEPRRAATVPVMRGGPVVMLLCPVDPHGLGLLHVGRGALANPTLLIQYPGHVLVQDHIRRPTTRCTRRPAMLAITAHPPALCLSWGWS